MKFFLVLCALVAMCAAGAVREKRGYSHGWTGYSGLGGYSGGGGWSRGYGGGYGGYSRSYSIPQIVTVRHVVPVATSYRDGYHGGYRSGYNGGYRKYYSGGHGGWW